MLQPSRRKSKIKKAAPRIGRWFAPAIIALGAAVSVCAALLAAGLTWPAIPFPFALAAHHEKRADLALSSAGARPLALERAAFENERTLASSPATATAWLRAAYIRQQRTGTLDADSLRYIETSYRVAPLGPGVSPWRVLFVFENWELMTPGIRLAALAEIRTFAASNKGARALVDTIRSPAGRLAAKLAIRKPYYNKAATQRYVSSTLR
jgi:hypothetical protein